MKCEVEFLAVGDHSKAGDAIVVRYGEPDSFKLMLVDGGTTETGGRIVEHIRSQFPNHAWIDDVVLTHSDTDHACGLRDVIRELPVLRLWVNIPWAFCNEVLHLFNDKRWTADGLRAAIRESYPVIAEIVDLANEKGVEVSPAFEGAQVGPFTVTSPSKYAYLHLLPQFRKTPDPDQYALESARMWIGKSSQGILARLLEAAARIVEWIPESWDIELLRDGGKTGADNESSVVMYGVTDAQRLLLTGDAGVEALKWTANFADQSGLPLRQFSFVQIPHHGSRRNVGPTILNRLIGYPKPDRTSHFTAFVSAPKDDASHPRKIVMNAFMRRGARVLATQGNGLVHYGGFPAREGYGPATPISFSASVEAYD